jgi:hypothetical protein
VGPQYGTVFLARRFLENLYSGSACNVRMIGGCRNGKDMENVGSSYHQCHWEPCSNASQIEKDVTIK